MENKDKTEKKNISGQFYLHNLHRKLFDNSEIDYD